MNTRNFPVGRNSNMKKTSLLPVPTSIVGARRFSRVAVKDSFVPGTPREPIILLQVSHLGQMAVRMICGD